VTDPDLVAKKLAVVETSVSELRTLARPEAVARDIKEQRFVEHTLQVAIQAALDVASHIVSDERLGEPLLARRGLLPAELADRLGRMAGFRNVLVHGYQDVDVAVLQDILANRLDDLLAFAQIVRARLTR